MAIGERMRYFRNLCSLTQRAVGEKIGFPEASADVRIAQYETENRKPKADTITQLAQIFDVAPEALDVPDIDTEIGLMHTLFTLEDMYGLTVTTLDNEICLKLDVNHPNYDIHLAEQLLSWNKMKSKLTSGSITTAKYDEWRHKYPSLDTSGRFRKTPSKELSKEMTKAFKKKLKDK